jgi:hypothetical protein
MSIITEKIEGKLITVEIESSNLKTALYNTENKELIITFKNGNIYTYSEVPWEVFTKLRMSDSQGKYFNSEIARKYTYQKHNDSEEKNI